MFLAPEDVFAAVEQCFGRKQVLVVGDLMLDVYLWGRVDRISPEAPVPVVKLDRRSTGPGGSGNVLVNLVGLGLRAVAAGYVGDDTGGQELVGLLAEAGVSTVGIVTLTDRPTTTKTRVYSGHHQMLRLDEEETSPVVGTDSTRLIEAVRAQLDANIAAVILSDYAKGVLTEEVCRFVITEADRLGIPVVVDPKGRSFGRYVGATALTPNLREFEAVTGLESYRWAEFLEAGLRLRDGLRLDFLVVTCADDGIKCFNETCVVHRPSVAREVFDVSGAGDTLIAVLTAGMVAGLCLDDVLQLANLGAGVVVGKIGATPIHHSELLSALRHEHLAGCFDDKVLELASLKRRVAEWRIQGKRIVFTNGCFDLLHVGHVALLARARSEGDRLIVGLNTDRSVRALKGASRPIVIQDDRARVLASLTSVDAVILFDEDTPLQLIEVIRPDVLVKGSDYTESQVLGADLVRSWGGNVVVVPLIEDRSTTKILAKSRYAASLERG
jgi:D-beta-D-heptose 7-phosphate kinase/D-beta-D-heptose 1-phosphate adenosyltransferase